MTEMTDAKLSFPQLVDATMIREFRSCPKKFSLSFMHNLTIGESTHLVAGKAFATGLEVARQSYYDEKNAWDKAQFDGYNALIEAYGDHDPPDHGSASNKTLPRMTGALEYYFTQFPLPTDTLQPVIQHGKAAIEYTFAIPIPGTAHPVTGDPILYGGRFDLLGYIGDDPSTVFVVDEKTTSQLGASWSRQWDMRSQFTGYCWAAKQSGHNVAGALIRGVSILKTKYDHAQAVVYRPDYMIDQWLFQLKRDIIAMQRCWEEGYWDYNLDDTCSSYGGCLFTPLCSSVEPERWMSQYTERNWDPLHKGV